MIPTIDLGAFVNGSAAESTAIAEKVDRTCQSTGFLVIENHGVPNSTMCAAWNSARQFFDLSLNDKLATRSTEAGCPRGYFPVEEEALAKTRGQESLPDLKEAFSSGPLHAPDGHERTDDFEFFYGENIWPVTIPGFRDSWTAYYVAMEALGATIMQLLAEALKLNTDFFESFHSHHLSALRGINYPAANKVESGPRAGAHSDYGTVTILLPDPEVTGLEVKTPGGDWIRPPAIENAFIVNIGDLMAHWTNGRWVSTLHRVVVPDEHPVPRRQSIAYFMNPNYDAEISVLPGCEADGTAPPPVTAGQFLIRKFRSAF